VLASIWFDDGSSKALSALLKFGLINFLAEDEAEEDEPSSPTGPDNFPVRRLHTVLFHGLTVAGWAIALQKPRVVQFFAKRGYDLTLPVDSQGTPGLHFIAQCGVAGMVDCALEKGARLEQLNLSGATAAMEAVRVGNFHVASRLFYLKADARQALCGGYKAWALAFVRRKEATEANLQTGRYGDDDTTYFPLAPDPYYSVWYTPTP
jgi:hypothetical protein